MFHRYFSLLTDQSLHIVLLQTGRSDSVVVDGKTHYHHHRHFHYHEPRSLSLTTEPPSLPTYNLRANSKYVEATFLFPHKNETSTAAVAAGHTTAFHDAHPMVIEAKKEGYVPRY